jgi:hypothetical protein
MDRVLRTDFLQLQNLRLKNCAVDPLDIRAFSLSFGFLVRSVHRSFGVATDNFVEEAYILGW